MSNKKTRYLSSIKKLNQLEINSWLQFALIILLLLMILWISYYLSFSPGSILEPGFLTINRPPILVIFIGLPILGIIALLIVDQLGLHIRNTMSPLSVIVDHNRLYQGVFACSKESTSEPSNRLEARSSTSFQKDEIAAPPENSNQSQDPPPLAEPSPQLKDLNIINQIIQALSASVPLLDIESACRTVLTLPYLTELFDFDTAEICLLDQDTDTLSTIFRLPQNSMPGRDNSSYQLGEGYTGWIALNQQSLLIDDVHQSIALLPRGGLSNFPYRSYLGTPLKVGTKFLGTLELAANIPHAFGQKEIMLLEIVANQVAIVMENARLFSLTNQELQKRLDELSGLQLVSGELNSTLDLDKILSTVLKEARRVTQADIGDVYFYQASTGNLVAYRQRVQPEVNHFQVEDSSSYPHTILAETGILGRAFRSGKAILVPDLLKDKDFIDLGHGSRSKVVVPILYGGESIGVINLESVQSSFFNINQLRYLEALANHAAIAIGNAKAYQQQKLEREQASRRADQLTRLSEISNAYRTNRPLNDVLEDIAFAVAESVGYDVVLISLVSETPPMIHHKVGVGIPLVQLKELQKPSQAKPLADLEEVMEEEFRFGNSYFIPATHLATWQDKLNIPYVDKERSFGHTRSQFDANILFDISAGRDLWQTGDLLITPLLNTNEHIIGILTVDNPINNLRPDPTQVQTLETFANYAATTIENAHLIELEQRRLRLTDTLRGIAETTSSHIEFDELLNIVLQELKKVVNYDKATVELLEEKRLEIVGGRGWEEYSRQMIGLSFSMEGNNPSRKVLETQEPVIVKNAQSEYSGVFSAPPYNRVRSWLGVPLTYGTNVLGLMSVSSGQLDFFTREDAKIVLAFANQVAVAWQNARLFDEARQQVRQLAALTEVAQSLNRALDLDEVLNLVLDAVFDLVGHDNGSIWLIDSSSETVKIANTENIPDFLVQEINQSDTSVFSEPFAAVIQSGQVLMVPAKEGERKVSNHTLPFPNEVTYVPLKTDDGVIGILAIEAIIPNKTMLGLVTTLADLAAVAIDSARLLADTRRRAAEMQQLYRLGVEVNGLLEVRQVMRSVISNTLTLMSSQLGLILCWDEEANLYNFEGTATTEQLVARFGFAEIKQLDINSDKPNYRVLWSDLTKQVVDKGQPIMANFSTSNAILKQPTLSPIPQNDLSQAFARKHGVQSTLGVPIFVQNEVSGAIFVSQLALHNFDDREIQLLSFVASQASVAIQNAQLVQRLNSLTEGLELRVDQRTQELAQTLQDLTEERDRVEILYQITRELSSSFDLDRVLNFALGLLNRAIGISLGSILLLDPDTEYLTYRAALGRDHPLPRDGIKTEYKVGYGLAGKVMEHREARLIPDLTHEPDWIAGDEDYNSVRRSALVVPLNTGDDILGAMLLYHPDPDYFTEDHLKLVTAASAQIATAVNNVELYRLITDQANRLRGMYQQQAAEAAKNEAILKGITDGVLVLDANHNIVLVNPKAAEILGIDAASVANQSLSRLLEQPETEEELGLIQLLYHDLSKALLKIETDERSVEFRIDSGSRSVVVALAPIILNDADLPSIVAVLRDISKEAEIERLKNEFISTVSHELRTPMTSIKGYADLLLSGNEKIGQLNPTQHRFVKVIQSNSDRLTELVNDILEISRIETGRVKLEFNPLDIIELINNVADSFEGQMVQKNLNFSLRLPDHLPNVYADKARLTQVLVNLIGNAWQYTPEGGSITVYANLIDEFVQVDVEDSGIGIVEKDVEYIFDRFFRSERTEVQVVDGTGLGLSITKSFVEMLGGQIWLKSQLDIGSTFSFTVPLDKGVQPNERIIDQPDSVTNPQLLIVDDNQDVIDLLKSNLREQGYQIVVLNSGDALLDFVDQANKAPESIILTISLKDTNSFSLLEKFKRVKSAANRIPIWLTSLYVDKKRANLYFQVIDYISTSANRREILERVAVIRDNGDGRNLSESRWQSRLSDHILIVEKDRTISSRLRDILTNEGYEVQAAFNGQQALDMAIEYKPVLALINPFITFEGEPIISRFRNTNDTADIPVILVTDQLIISDEQNKVKFLNTRAFSGPKQPVSVKGLVAKLTQNEEMP